MRLRQVAVVLALTVCLVASAPVQAAGVPSLRRADWAGVTVPASVCGSHGAVRLHGWSATVSSSRWRSAPRVAVAAGHQIVYGELAPGLAAAAMQVSCSNLGGTAAGQLAFAVVVYEAGVTGPRPVGVLTPRAPSASGVHVPLLAAVAIAPGKLTVEQFTYGPGDPDCCPSGRATTVWSYRDGAFRPLSTVVDHRPSA
jgi:hypothetical protein